MAYESKIFSIDPEAEKRIHPEALKVLTNWEKFELLMLQAEITAADIDGYLEDNEKAELQRCVNQIWEGLKTCMDIGDKVTLYDVYIGDIFLKNGIISDFQRTSRFPLFSLKSLLEKACGRKLEKERREAEEAREKKRREEEQERQEAAKAEEERKRQIEKAEQERKKKEEEERWHAAYRALNVPHADAEKYLEPEDLHRFIESIAGAVRAYMDKGESYTDDSRANDYLFYCDVIKRRKDKEQRKLAAAESARLFSYSLNEKINKLKASLYLTKRSPTKYFGKDSRYTGQRFYDLLSPDERKDIFDTVQTMVKQELDELVSGELSNFIGWKHTQYYRLLPTVDYVLDEIPCLDFSFDTEIVVEAEIWLKPSQKTFGGYVFDLPVIEENNYPVRLQEPKFLGYYYVHFAASKLPSTFWQRIPLLLIASLSRGETEPPGVTILEASQSAITYRIKNFEKEVIIPAIFIDFLKAAGGIEGMMGIMTQEVADIVQRKLTEVGATPVKQTSESTQPGSYSNEEFISRMAELSYSKKDSEILLQHIPRDLGLDEALKWSSEHYRETIVESHCAGSNLAPEH